MASVVLAGTWSACGQDKSASAGEVKSASTFFPIKIGNRTANLQIAALPNEQMLGLMHRKDLKPDDGMIFVFPRSQRMSFYMRNTPTPLSIGYFDAEGVLREIYPMYPFDETTVNSRSDRIQFAVEMNQGWYERNGVRAGEKLDVKAVAEALKARGQDPVEYGMRKSSE